MKGTAYAARDRWNLLTFVALAVLGLFAQTVASASRIALVVGVDAYQDPDLPRLQKARSDAAEVTMRLREFGFEVVLVSDADLQTARAELEAFVLRHGIAEGGAREGIAVFFFAGHGVEYQGSSGPRGNYVLLKDSTDDDIAGTGLPLSEVVNGFHRLHGHHSVLLLDACRDVRTRALRPLKVLPAMGRMNLLPRNSSMLIQYATAFDEKTLDVGHRGRGPFTGELLQHLGTPGESLQDSLANTANAVKTSYGLTPFQEGTLSGVVILRPLPWWRGGAAMWALAFLALAAGLVILQRQRYRPTQLRVVRVLDVATGRCYCELPGGSSAIIGRDSDARIRIDHPAISRRHARLSFDGVSMWIEDLSSAGGTWLDAAWRHGAASPNAPADPQRLEPAKRRELRDGERVWLSERTAQLRVEIGAPAAAGQARATAP